MRVLQIHTRYRHPGGEDVAVETEARLLREAGLEVRQVMAENPDTVVGSAAGLVVSAWNPIGVRRVKAAVADFRPDIAHVHNTWFSLSAATIRGLKSVGVPVAMTLHNYRLACANGLLFRDGAICEECVGSGPWNAVKYGCYRNSRSQSAFAAASIDLHQRLGTWADRVDMFIALTEFQRDVLIRAGLPPEKVIVKPNSAPDPGPRPALPGQSNVVLFVGRLSYEKGVDLLLDAWYASRPDGLELVVVGDGPMRNSLEAQAPTGVRFPGQVTPAVVSELMLNARAAILPSRWYEGLPTVMLEAFAAGTPVAAASHGSLGQLISDGPGSPWVVRDGSVAGWAAMLGRLHDADWCDRGGRGARLAYESRYTPETNIRALEGVYSTVIANHRGQASAG